MNFAVALSPAAHRPCCPYAATNVMNPNTTGATLFSRLTLIVASTSYDSRASRRVKRGSDATGLVRQSAQHWSLRHFYTNQVRRLRYSGPPQHGNDPCLLRL